MRNTFIATAAVLAISAAPALAGQTAGQTPTTGTKSAGQTATTKPADEGFVRKVAEAGMAEIELGKLAAEKATSESVKKFGQRMADDHSKANDELKAIAQQKNISLPTGPTVRATAEHERLAKLSGDAFDRAFMKTMVADHHSAVSEFSAEAKSGKDPELKAWAEKTLPTLQDHLKVAEETNRTVVGTSGTKK